MTSVRKILTLTAVALGLALGAPSVAAADAGFRESFSMAGPDGASLTVVRSHVGDDGKVSYERVTYTATRDGAGMDRTTSSAG